MAHGLSTEPQKESSTSEKNNSASCQNCLWHIAGTGIELCGGLANTKEIPGLRGFLTI